MNRLSNLQGQTNIEVGDIYSIREDAFQNSKARGICKIVAIKFVSIFSIQWIVNPWTGQHGNFHLDTISRMWIQRPGTKYLGKNEDEVIEQEEVSRP